MGNVLTFARDSLTNLVSRLGTSRDKAAASYYGFQPLTDEQILVAYKTAWLPRKIVDIPAFDSVRAWRDWQADDGQIELIEAEEKRLNVKGKVHQAKVRARLWGGSAIMLGTGDSDLSQPLEIERVGKGGLKYLTVLSRRHLAAGEKETDAASEFYDQPKFYTLSTANAQQLTIHPSRLVIFHGNTEPDDDLATQQGWGDSVLQTTMDAIKQADGTAANIASLVFEAKIDIIRIPDFMASMADEGYKQKIIDRYTLAMQGKGINGTLMLDKDEEYESKTTSFATLPDVLDRFLQIVSGAADIPATRLLSQAPAGMNATGESDLRNYYDRLSAMQELEMEPAMARMDECIIRSALGSRDAAIYFDWSPLWGLSDKEKAEIFKMKADGARSLAGTGTSPELMPIDALSDALVNTFIEDNSLPGLEAAIDEYGKLSEQEEDPAEVEASLTPAANQNAPAAQEAKRLASKDAAPRTLYVRRDVVNVAEIKRWAEEQGFTDIVPDLHVTIAYSRDPVDWFKVGTSWSEKIEIAPGGPRQVERMGPTGEYIALLITASELVWRHKEIVEAGASWSWPDYQPHISIQVGGDVDLSKVKAYQGRIVLGPEIFEEVRED
jgi:phage-related protein (TIGR01555 family)